jgi:hypothetical protein
MQYRLELDIERPRKHVVDLFLDPTRLGDWQPDFVSFDPVTGHGTRAVGDRSRLVHTMGGRDVETMETIAVYDYPEHFAALYETEGIINFMDNRFTQTVDNQTRWILEAECKTSGLFMNLLGVLAPGVFRRQTQKFMSRFKTFVETGPN